jgi:hypothetical protein
MGSVLRFTQLDPHKVSPGTVHDVLQTPAEHTWPAAHALPQLPQLAPSDCVFTHVPLQSVIPAWHWQTPAMHPAPGEQTLSQLPQLLGS